MNVLCNWILPNYFFQIIFILVRLIENSLLGGLNGIEYKIIIPPKEHGIFNIYKILNQTLIKVVFNPICISFLQIFL